jgi:hypothetical protein
MRKLITGMATVLLLASSAGADENANEIEDQYIYAIKPAANREAVKPMKPDWCGSYARKGKFNGPILSNPQGQINDNMRQGFDEARVIRHVGWEDYQQIIAHTACEWPDDPSVQKQVAFWRQLSINVSGLSEKEDRDTLKFLFGAWDERGRKMQDEQQVKYKQWDRDPSVDQGTRVIRSVIKSLLF